MKFVIAPDSFKGSISSNQFCQTVKKGIGKVLPNSEFVALPLGDGGEGTFASLKQLLQLQTVVVQVSNPFFKNTKASYYIDSKTATAYIELASASGLHLLAPSAYNTLQATTLGTGQLILHAIKNGAKTIILGLGGSATTDAGMGMAHALGYRFFDTNNNVLQPIGENLSKVKRICANNVIKELYDINIKVACDVTNPLYGTNGAAYVYASQKGASSTQVKYLDQGLQNIAKVMQLHFNKEVHNVKGAGAAGGCGAGAITFLNGTLVSGITLIKEIIQLDTHLQNAQWLITGEGRLDSQTLSGKVIHGLLQSAKKQNVPVAAFCGSVLLSIAQQKALGLTYATAICNQPTTLEQAIRNTENNLELVAYNFAQMVKQNMHK